MKVRRDKDGDPLGPGLEQLSQYLDRLGLDTGSPAAGTLILFDLRGDAPPMAHRCSRETREHAGRKIIVLRL